MAVLSGTERQGSVAADHLLACRRPPSPCFIRGRRHMPRILSASPIPGRCPAAPKIALISDPTARPPRLEGESSVKSQPLRAAPFELCVRPA